MLKECYTMLQTGHVKYVPRYRQKQPNKNSMLNTVSEAIQQANKDTPQEPTQADGNPTISITGAEAGRSPTKKAVSTVFQPPKSSDAELGGNEELNRRHSTGVGQPDELLRLLSDRRNSQKSRGPLQRQDANSNNSIRE